MKNRVIYVVAVICYLVTIGIGIEFFGLNGGFVAAVMTTVIGLLLKLFDPTTTDSDTSSNEDSDSDQTLVNTLTDRKEEAKSRLSNHITLQENTQGEIELQLDTDDINGYDRKAMLYVFGQWAKADEDSQSTPVLTKHEIRNNTGLKGRAVGVFLGKMGPFLERHYPEDPGERVELVDGEVVRMDEQEMTFELNEDQLEEIVEYILGERDSPD